MMYHSIMKCYELYCHVPISERLNVPSKRPVFEGSLDKDQFSSTPRIESSYYTPNCLNTMFFQWVVLIQKQDSSSSAVQRRLPHVYVPMSGDMGGQDD